MKKLTFYLFILCANLLFSQKHIDIITAETSVAKNSNYINPHVLLPLMIDSSNVLLLNLGYKRSSFENKNSNQNDLYNEYLGSLGWRHAIKKGWSITSLLINRLRNQKNSINSSLKDRYQIGGALIVEKKKSESLAYKGGVYLNKDAFGPLLVPMLGLDWRVNDHLQLKTLFPLNAAIYYHVNKKSSLSIRFKGIIESYKWRTEAFDNTNQELSNRKLYTQVSFNEFVLVYELEPIKSLVIQGKAGLLIGTKNKQYEQDAKVPLTVSAIRFGDHRSIISESQYNGWIVGLSFIYRVHL